MTTTFSRTRRTVAGAAMTAGLLALGAGAASAHVHVDPDSTAAGGYTQLTFTVPNESETAKTNKLEVTLPSETPFNSVSVKPVEGWTAQVITTDLPKPVTVDGATVTNAPTSVVWTADAAHQIGQNEYQTFSISVGVLPKEGTALTLPAAQTYTDGTVVKWDEKTVDGQDEPKHPAPAFTTTGAADDHAHGSTTATTTTAAPAAAGSTASTTDSGSKAGWFGLAAGLIGLAAGVTALARTRPIRSR
jgi:uncharacterized protein YcnI